MVDLGGGIKLEKLFGIVFENQFFVGGAEPVEGLDQIAGFIQPLAGARIQDCADARPFGSEEASVRADGFEEQTERSGRIENRVVVQVAHAFGKALHLAANGDEASVIFFGTFFALSLAGTFSIDAKRKRKLGTAWDAFASKTSNIPFAAVIAGRGQLHLGESFGWRFWVATILFLAILFAHARIFGVSPFPGGWVPF